MARLYLVHEKTGDTISAQFNPTEIEESLEVVYRNIAIQGESHEPLEYDRTRNLEIGFTLAFDADSGNDILLDGSGVFGAEIANLPQRTPRTFARGQASPIPRLNRASLVRKFLFACCYPMRNTGTIRSAAPSRILVVWPGFMSVSARLTKVVNTNRQFESVDIGRPVLFSMDLSFEVDSPRRIYYEDVVSYGTERTGGFATGGVV